MQDKTLQRLLAFLLLITVILVGVAVQAVRNINRAMASSDWVNHTHAVLLQAEALRSALHVGDGALHTYVYTGDARDLAACREALASVADHLEITRALTRLEPAQHEQVLQIEAPVRQHTTYLETILAARQAGNTEAVRTLLAADAGGAAVREIQRKIDKLKGDQLALLSERDTASYLQAQTTRWTVWSGVVLNVFLLGGVAWLIRDDLAARRRATAALQEANEKLELRVQERTAGLTAANARLATENLERQWANQALEHQVRYNQLIIDSISDLVLVVTKALNISRVNPAVVHLTGRETAALIDQPLARVVRLASVAPDRAAPAFDPLARALKEGRDLRDQPAIVEDVRGQHIPARFTLFPLRDRDKVVGAIVTIQVNPTAAPRG